jgi:DNA-directed RNA polymerase II subunit RPB1
MLDDLM